MQASTLTLIGLVASLPSLALAQQASTTPPGAPAPLVDDAAGRGGSDDAQREHQGFMLRMTAGLAALGAGIENDESPDIGTGGVGQAFGVSLGGFIAPNLALHGDLMAAFSSHAVVDVDDPDMPTSHHKDFDLGAIGMGMTYYWMPYNLSFSGSLLVGEMSVDTARGPTLKTDYAVFGKLGVAKLWTVADDWNLGVGATVLVGSGEGEDNEGQDFTTDIGGLSLDVVASYD